MATENIRIKYEVDKKQLDASNKSLEKSAKANNLTQKEVDQTTAKFKKQDKQLSKTNKSFSGLGDQLKSMGNRFQIAGKGAGDMAAGMFKVSTATNVTSKAMKVLKFAIASTGIGLLVIALGSLIAFFTKTQRGSDLLSKAMAGIGATVDVLIGRLSTLGEKIFKAFEDPKQSIKDLGQFLMDNIVNRFTAVIDLIKIAGEGFQALANRDIEGMKKAASDAGQALVQMTIGLSVDQQKKIADGLSKINEEIGQAVEESGEYEDLLIKIENLEIAATAQVAKRSRIVQDLLLATKDGSLDNIEQQKALNEVERLQIQNQVQLTELATEKLNLAEMDLANTPIELRSREQLLAVAQAQAAVDAQIGNEKARQRDTANRQLELNTRILNFAKAAAAEEAKIAATKQAAADQQAAIEAEELARKSQAIFDLEIIKLESEGRLEAAELARRARLLENLELFEEERQLIIQQSVDAITEIRKTAAEEEAEIDEESDEAQVESANKTLAVAKGVLNKETIAAKAASIGQIGISTSKATIAAFEPPPVGLGPVFGAFLATLVIARGAVEASKVAGINPKFERGGRIGGNLHSNGGTMIDAERDEFVMSRKATNKYGFDFMDKINNLELNDLTIKGNGTSVNIIDTKEIAEQLKNMPQNVINVDSEGFALHQRRGQYMISQKIERYST